MTTAIPGSINEITPTFLNKALAQVYPGTDVETVRCSSIGTGQMANSVRAEFAQASSHRGVPESVVVKFASADATSRHAGASGAYLKEVRFYEEIADYVDIDVPRCFYAAIDTNQIDFVLVLEDMSPAQQGDQIAGCSIEQAANALRNVGGLHAPRWGDPTLFDVAWLGSAPDVAAASQALLQAVMIDFTEGFIDRYRDRTTASEQELLRWFAQRTAGWLADHHGVFALTHSDYRLDNLLFGADERITTVDWQTLSVRNPMADVAYLIGTSLSTDDRRNHERDLVAGYHAGLEQRGVTGFDAETCFEHYRSQTFHSLLITVLGSMMTGQTSRGDDMFMAMLHRSVTQIEDLESQSLL